MHFLKNYNIYIKRDSLKQEKVHFFFKNLKYFSYIKTRKEPEISSEPSLMAVTVFVCFKFFIIVFIVLVLKAN